MNGPDLNLAGRPFVNDKPVRRVARLLWLLGLALLALDAWLYWQYFSGANRTRGEETNLQGEFQAERNAIAELEQQLAGVNLTAQNRQASFINEKIAQRTFAWGVLFDRLAEVLPNEVRLTSLSPQFGAVTAVAQRSRRGVELAAGEVQLEIRGAASNGEQVLAFLDSLFEHPNFRAPDLSNEAKRETYLDFSLSVIYQPEAERTEAEEGAAGQEDEDGSPEGEDDTPEADAETPEGEPDSPEDAGEPSDEEAGGDDAGQPLNDGGEEEAEATEEAE